VRYTPWKTRCSKGSKRMARTPSSMPERTDAPDRRRGSLLTASFYERPVVEVARDLLDAILVHEQAGGRVAGRIVETEAYAADADAASHAYRGKTARNASMFGPAGRAYVYRSYGLHYCLNVVTTPPGGAASAVLIRALEVVEGLEIIRRRRPGAPDDGLLRGPGNVCKGMDIGIDLDGEPLDGSSLGIYQGACTHRHTVTTTRVGITRSIELPWRFYLLGAAAVSRRARAAEIQVKAQCTNGASTRSPEHDSFRPG
jgi:DNA-3-methyladenine glycosylase